MKRWHVRITGCRVADDHLVDDFYAFFVSCFQLKDWLKADPSVDASVGREAEELVKRDTSLGVCADLANRMKHCNIRRVRQDRGASLAAVWAGGRRT